MYDTYQEEEENLSSTWGGGCTTKSAILEYISLVWLGLGWSFIIDVHRKKEQGEFDFCIKIHFKISPGDLVCS